MIRIAPFHAAFGRRLISVVVVGIHFLAGAKVKVIHLEDTHSRTLYGMLELVQHRMWTLRAESHTRRWAHSPNPLLATLVTFCMQLDLDLSLPRFTDWLLNDNPQTGARVSWHSKHNVPLGQTAVNSVMKFSDIYSNQYANTQGGRVDFIWELKETAIVCFGLA